MAMSVSTSTQFNAIDEVTMSLGLVFENTRSYTGGLGSCSQIHVGNVRSKANSSSLKIIPVSPLSLHNNSPKKIALNQPDAVEDKGAQAS
jgi:hypothetical protein